MHQLKEIPEDVLIILISQYLAKETPLLIMIDKFFYNLVYNFTPLKLIHFSNYKNNQHWLNIIQNDSHLINWFFFESQIMCTFKTDVCPSFLSNFVTHENFNELVSQMNFEDVHPDVIISAIQNNQLKKLETLCSSCKVESCEVLLGLKEPSEPSPTSFFDLLKLYHKTSLDVSFMINLLKYWQSFDPLSIRYFVYSQPKLFLTPKTNEELFKLLAEVCCYEFTLVKYFVCKHAPHLKSIKLPKLNWNPNNDTYHFYELLELDHFVNDFSLICFVMNDYPDTLIRNRCLLWTHLIRYCHNVQVLDYFHQMCPLPKKISTTYIKSLETWEFLKNHEIVLTKDSLSCKDLRLLNFLNINIKGYQEKDLSKITLNSIKIGYYHPSMSSSSISKTSANRMVSFMNDLPKNEITYILENLMIVNVVTDKNFTFLLKLLLRESILQESITMIHSLSRFVSIGDQDLLFAAKKHKTASRLFISSLLNASNYF